MKIYLCVDVPHFDGEHNSETEAVFTSKRNAKRFCKETGFEVREIDMDQFEKAMALNYKLFDVTIDKDRVLYSRKANVDYLSASSIDVCKFSWDNSAFDLKCFAKDEQHAINLATAMRDQMLKENSWPPKPVAKSPKIIGDMPLKEHLLGTAVFDPYKDLYKRFTSPASPNLMFSQLMEDSSIHGTGITKKPI